MHVNIANANKLSPEMTTFLFNKYLKPKLEYRMNFMDIPTEKLKEWDILLTSTLSRKIGNRSYTRIQAMQLVLGIELPTNFYQIVQTSALEKAINENTDMGKTSRARLKAECKVCERYRLQHSHNSDIYCPHISASIRRQKERALDNNIKLTHKTNWNNQLPDKLAKDQEQRKCNINGVDILLPSDHFGTWGKEEKKISITIATDGSLRHNNKEEYTKWGLEKKKTVSGWSMFVLNDWFKDNWELLHEDQNKIERIKLIQNNISHWGGVVELANSSFHPELVALIKALMIFPESWDITWITDSKSAMLAYEAIDNAQEQDSNKTNWQLFSLLKRLKKKRKGKIHPIHQYSHKKEHNINSVANATADILADLYAIQVRGHDSTTQIDTTFNNNRFLVTELDTGIQLTTPIRKWMKERNNRNTWQTWKRESSEKGVAKEIKNMHRYLRKKNTNSSHSNNRAHLINIITQAHTKDSHDEKVTNTCDYCEHEKDIIVRRDKTHEANCRINRDISNQLIQTIEEDTIERIEKVKGRSVRKEESEEKKETIELMLLLGGIEPHTHRMINNMTNEFVENTDSKREFSVYNNTIRSSLKRADDYMKTKNSTNNMIKEVMEIDIQTNTTFTNKMDNINNFHSVQPEETLLGAKTTATLQNYNSLIETSRDEHLKQTIITNDLLLTLNNKARITIISNNNIKSRKTLTDNGYTTIAKQKKPSRMISIKMGTNCTKTPVEKLSWDVLTMQKWGKRRDRTINIEGLIRASGGEKHWGEDWKTNRSTQITKAMSWIRTPRGMMGANTDRDTDKLVELGIDKITATKITEEASLSLFTCYVEDNKRKEKVIKDRKLKAKWARQEKKKKEIEMEAEKRNLDRKENNKEKKRTNRKGQKRKERTEETVAREKKRSNRQGQKRTERAEETVARY
jgi:hypothetical protein